MPGKIKRLLEERGLLDKAFRRGGNKAIQRPFFGSFAQ